MTVRLALLAGLIVCSACEPAASITDATTPSATLGVEEHISINPIALGNPELVAAIDRHTWLAHYGRAWVGNQEPFDIEQTPTDHIVLAVIDQTPKRLQVVSQLDDANVAVWIERRDVTPTL